MAVNVARRGVPAPSPTETALEGAFLALHSNVRRAHVAPLTAAGTMDVAHGSHWIAPVLIKLMNLPPAGAAQPVRLVVTSDGNELEWRRQFGSALLRTRQRATGTTIVERNGLGRIVFSVRAVDGALVYHQLSMSVAGIPVPACVAPRVESRVSSTAGGWHVDVRVTWRAHFVCRYAGCMAAA